MKRRGFLGFAAGAVVAGPGMAKEAAAKAAQSLALSGIGQGNTLNGLSNGAPTIGYAAQQSNPVLQATQALAKISAMTTEQRAKRKRMMNVGAIDPDIASYRSISLSAKIDWQKERQVTAMINERRSMWQRVVDGLPHYDDYEIF